MDIVWLILDSLGFGETSLAPDGPDTTPQLAALAAGSGVSFDRAYAPGPASPSSHASFFTGELPSETGMHEARPQFDGKIPTIADTLNSTHRTHIASVNPFLFTGLADSFDVVDDLAAQDYLLFESGTDPRSFDREADAEGFERYLSFLADGGTPFRNLFNGFWFKLWRARGNEFIPQSVDGASGTYRYAGALNERIREAVSDDNPAFVVANYMDVHPPLSASEEAIERFADGYDGRLPIGVRAEDTDDYDPEAMVTLYRAAIWDLDRTIAPLIRDLITDETMVIVTADHGPRFGRGDYLTEKRLHVPLIIFTPGEAARTVPHTVSIQSLPRTTIERVRGRSEGYSGYDLLTVDEDQTVVTEYLHRTSGDPGPVSFGGGDESLTYDLYLRHGDAVLRLESGRETLVEGDPEILDSLRKRMSRLRSGVDERGSQRTEFDDTTAERLEDLGYL